MKYKVLVMAVLVTTLLISQTLGQDEDFVPQQANNTEETVEIAQEKYEAPEQPGQNPFIVFWEFLTADQGAWNLFYVLLILTTVLYFKRIENDEETRTYLDTAFKAAHIDFTTPRFGKRWFIDNFYITLLSGKQRYLLISAPYHEKAAKYGFHKDGPYAVRKVPYEQAQVGLQVLREYLEQLDN